MSYTGEPGRVRSQAREGRDEDEPRPLRARPRLPQDLDIALSAVTKWRRGPVLSGSRPSSFGSSVLCACAFALWLSIARDFGFCRLCLRAPASGPRSFLPPPLPLAWPFRTAQPQAALSQALALLIRQRPRPPAHCLTGHPHAQCAWKMSQLLLSLASPGLERLQVLGRAVDIWKVWTEQGPGGLSLSLAWDGSFPW